MVSLIWGKIPSFASNLYKSENCTLTVYKSKPNVKVLLLSTKHRGIQVEDNYKHVPETIAFYNKTKFGVDVVDQIACKHSVKAGSFRCSIQVFFQYFGFGSDKRMDIMQRVHRIENIPKGVPLEHIMLYQTI